MATRMIQRRGTAAEWTAANPVLAAGEIGFETDTTKFKFGDGATAWADITYFASADALIDGAPELLDTLNELAAAIGDDADFVTTISTDIANKLPLAGGILTGDLTLAGAPTADLHASSKKYVDDIAQSLYDAAVNTASSDLDSKISSFVHVFVTNQAPVADANEGGALQGGDLWLDSSIGALFVYVPQGDGSTFVWVEVGNNDDLDDVVPGTNSLAFSATPNNGDAESGYIYDSSRTAWVIDHARNIDYLADVNISAVAQDDVLMYNATSGEWENVDGVRLDENNYIPLGFMTNALNELRNGSTSQDLAAVEALISTNADAVAAAQTDVDAITAGVSESFNTLLQIETYLLEHSTTQTEAEWTADASVPILGSINISTGSEVRLKIGDGTNTFDNLEYVPTNTYVAGEIATAIAPLAPKASPTFTGTVSLPSTTSIGDVSDAEIAHLDGVTSGIQGQLDSLDTLKAPIADPTFTGTVSGVTASMVGLGNVDNTADADKPVSTATQTALDLKANLSGATFGGSVVIEGDLTVSGATTTVYASDLSVRDNMIYLNQGGYFTVTAATGDGANVTYTTDGDHLASVGEYITVTGADPATFDISGDGLEITAVTSNTITVASTVTDTFVSGGSLRVKSHANPDLGWSAGRYDVVNGAGYGHAGIFRDATDGVFKIYDGYVPEPDESVFIDTTDASFALAPVAVDKVVFADGTEQSAAGVPSVTGFTEKTASYTLDTLDHQDNIIEMNLTAAGTFTIPTDAALAWPVGASMDVFASGTGEITIAGDTGVTVNSTPGLILRTQWSSATLLKRGANNWVVYGDLKA